MKIPEKLSQKNIEKLCSLVNAVQINIEPILYGERMNNYGQMVQEECMASIEGNIYEPPENFKVALSYNWDNMPQTLVHECTHIMFPYIDDSVYLTDIDKLEILFWNEPLVRKVARERLIDALGKHKL